jgi:hypothetical protein
MTKDNRQGLLKLVPELLQKLRAGLEGISYSPVETTQLFKQLESLHLGRLKSAPLSVPEKSIPVPEKPVAVKPQVQLTTIQMPSINLANITVAPSVSLAANQPENLKTSELGSDEVAEDVVSPVVQTLGDVVVDAPIESVAHEEPEVEPLVPVGATLESLESILVVSDAPEIVPDLPDSLAEGDQHLALVGNITQGSWFEMQSDDGQKFRCRLAAIIRATGKYIFVNRSGVKVAEETRMTLALALKSGRLHILDDGMLFDRALEAVIGNLRQGR